MNFPTASYAQAMGCSASGCVRVCVVCMFTFLLLLYIWAWD